MVSSSRFNKDSMFITMFYPLGVYLLNFFFWFVLSSY